MDSRKFRAGNCDDARKVSCGNSKIALYILPARRQPGPRGAPPAALAADPLLPSTVHFQSENALLIDFSKGNGLPEIQGWKLR